MKYIKNIKNALLLAAAAFMAVGFASCEDQPDKYEPTGGVPTIKYIRPSLPGSADSLLVQAYMEDVICIVGDNLRSVHEVWFNDRQALLNTNYITDHTLIVAVPKDIPAEVTDKIYFKTLGGATVEYDFKVKVPNPVIFSMSNEWAQPGDEVTMSGNYFCQDPNTPLKVVLPGNIEVTELKDVTLNSLTFTIPENAAAEGRVTVTSVHGSGSSSFYFHDTRGMLFDWDGVYGHARGSGWRAGDAIIGVREEIPSLCGNYICFNGHLPTGDAWPDEDNQSFNYWAGIDGAEPLSSSFDANKWNQLTLKFEIYIPSSYNWCSRSLQCIFSPVKESAGNGHLGDDTTPRGVWTPWRATGGYNTADKWVTVSMPLNSFTLDRYGASSGGSLNPSCFGSFDMLLYNGPELETPEGEILMGIDNIRVVPAY